MVLNIAKLALITGFAVMADAKKGKGKWGRKDSSESEEITEVDDEIVAETIDTLPERLQKRGKKNKKNKKNKKDKKGCNEPDFAKGVLASIADAIAEGEEKGQPLSMDDLHDMIDVILGEDFDPEGNKGFERGFGFGEKKLEEGAMTGCSAECVNAPFAEECQSCCKTFNHRIDWNCDSTDPALPAAKCCTDWSEDCYTTDSADNNNHACKDCYGYGYGRGYGYGGYGYGRGYGYRG